MVSMNVRSVFTAMFAVTLTLVLAPQQAQAQSRGTLVQQRRGMCQGGNQQSPTLRTGLQQNAVLTALQQQQLYAGQQYAAQAQLQALQQYAILAQLNGNYDDQAALYALQQQVAQMLPYQLAALRQQQAAALAQLRAQQIRAGR